MTAPPDDQLCKNDAVQPQNIPPCFLPGFLLIAAICLVIYCDTWNASWHMDDFPNIVTNPLIHIRNISIKSLLQASNLLEDQNAIYSGTAYRPLSYLTFALNWYADGDRVWGYHIVNICIHILCAGCLYFFLLSLFESPNLKRRFEGMENDIALLAAILWAVHPIQTQAVTYIVQRMCLLATLFYTAGMICYVKARIHPRRRTQIMLYSGCFLCLLLGVLSKENAVMLPLSLGLIEITFFQNFSIRRYWKKVLLALVAAGVFTLATALIFANIIHLNPATFIQNLAKTRSFTVTQRLMTEPRIVSGYLGQIFFPALHSFSIEHMVKLSTSWFEPVRTLAPALFIAGLLILALCRLRVFPILSFSILFYFINQIIESSVIPLELVFEHRNYLPSSFLFFPVATGIVQVMQYYRNHHRLVMMTVCASLTAVLIAVLGLTTYARNKVWETEKTLWEDALPKAPDSARPYAGLAWYFNETGQPDTALKFYEMSLSKKWANPSFRAIPLYSMAGIYARNHEYEKALSFYDRSLACNPDYLQTLYSKAVLLTTLGRWREAKRAAEILVSKKTMPWDDLNLMGYILLKQNDPYAALPYLSRADRQSPFNPKIYVNIGAAMSMMRHYQRADWFLLQASRMAPEDIVPQLALAANHIRSGNTASLNRDLDILFQRFSVDAIRNMLQNVSDNKVQAPLPIPMLSEAITQNLASRCSKQFMVSGSNETDK